MKWAPGPLLFLGACRIAYVLGANHGESPCGRSAEGTTQGARPSEEGWDRSECRCKAQAYFEPPNSVTARKIGNGSVTTSNRCVTACNGPVIAGNAFVMAPRLRSAGGEENAVTHTIKNLPCNRQDPPLPREQAGVAAAAPVIHCLTRPRRMVSSTQGRLLTAPKEGPPWQP